MTYELRYTTLMCADKVQGEGEGRKEPYVLSGVEGKPQQPGRHLRLPAECMAVELTRMYGMASGCDIGERCK